MPRNSETENCQVEDGARYSSFEGKDDVLSIKGAPLPASERYIGLNQDFVS